MRPDAARRALIVQLARLGDLVQSLPAITALRGYAEIGALDLLCPSPLASIGACIDGIDRVLPWEVERWRKWAGRWTSSPSATLAAIEAYLQGVMPEPYGLAFNLNQHHRAIFAATLLGRHVVGPGELGPLTDELPPWAGYLRGVVRERECNRVHLADIFCGLCGVTPPGRGPQLRLPPTELPGDLASLGDSDGSCIAIVIGAGDAARCVPPSVWREWIMTWHEASPEGQVALVGSEADRESAAVIQDGLSSLCLGRVWDATGRTSLVQTAALLARCRWVIGSDTGPLHLGAAVGARVMGFYFARARVHETGPYGEGHWTWQAVPAHGRGARGARLEDWPIADSVQLIMGELTGECEGWRLWQSHVDRWGAYHVADRGTDLGEAREEVWRRVHRSLSVKAWSHEYV